MTFDEIVASYEAGIYAIFNQYNGHYYYGQSTQVRTRLKKHRQRLNAGRHENPRLQREWEKYGPDVFLFEVLGYCHPDRLDDLEEMMIVPDYDDPKNLNIAKDARKPPNSTGLKRGPKPIEDRAKLRASITGETFEAALCVLNERDNHKADAFATKTRNAYFKELLRQYNSLLPTQRVNSRRVLNIPIVHDDGRTDVLTTMPEFVDKYGYTMGTVKKFVYGTNKCCFGWRKA